MAVDRAAKVPAYEWVIAVATAMQEVGLRNLDHGDRDGRVCFSSAGDLRTAYSCVTGDRTVPVRDLAAGEHDRLRLLL